MKLHKNYFLALFAGLMLNACGEKNPANQETGDLTIEPGLFGNAITEENAIPLSELSQKLSGTDSLNIKVQGKITDVCQKKGCWMDMDLGNGQTMKVTFRDYGFFVPKGAAGKNAVIEGSAYLDTLSVDELRHYAQDGGATQAEIDSIQKPEVEISFVADGVVIK